MQRMEKEFKIESLSGLAGGSASTPKSTQTQTNPNDVEQVNLAQMAGGKNGSLEIQKYLYETGLQNIFNDYNKQIASLDASKQKEIEDAYYVRELSKKYLGEYASNIGIGDVSGQILDIYGNYQSNMNEINANFNELQTGLESSYNEKKNEYELGLLQTQMDIETVEQQEQLEKDLEEINYNISLGLYPEGMDAQEYLDSVRNKIGESNYWSLATQNKLVEMSDTVNGALKNTNDYKNQGEWDIYVDNLLSNKSINKQQADYLKGMYEFEQNSNFTLVPGYFGGLDNTYFNSNNNLVKNGKTFVSRNGEYVISETTNVIDEFSTLYNDLKKHITTTNEDGTVSYNTGFDEPFGFGGAFFVRTMKDNQEVFVQYDKINTNKTVDKLSNAIKNDEKNVEQYNNLDKVLNKKSGVYNNISYTYNEKEDAYVPYINIQYTNILKDKGTVVIDGTTYSLGEQKGDYYQGQRQDGSFRPMANKESKELAKLFADKYYGGSLKEFNKDQVANRVGDGSKSIVVEYNGKRYIMSEGKVYILEKQ